MHLTDYWPKPAYTCYPLIPLSDTLRSVLACDDLYVKIENIFFCIQGRYSEGNKSQVWLTTQTIHSTPVCSDTIYLLARGTLSYLPISPYKDGLVRVISITFSVYFSHEFRKTCNSFYSNILEPEHFAFYDQKTLQWAPANASAPHKTYGSLDFWDMQSISGKEQSAATDLEQE